MKELDKVMENKMGLTSLEETGQKIEELKSGRIFSLKKMLVMIMILCWFVPVMVVFIGFYNFYQDGIINKSQKLYQKEVSGSAAMLAIKLNECINDSKKLSYQRNLEYEWRDYEKGVIDREQFNRNASRIISAAYRFNQMYDLSVMYLEKEVNDAFPYTMLGMEAYTNDVKRVAHAVTASKSYKTFVRIIDGNVYIIRNMFTITDVRMYGTLVLGLNSDRLFTNISANHMNNVAFTLNDSAALIALGEESIHKHRDIVNKGRKSRELLLDGEVGILEEEDNECEGYVVHIREKDYWLHTLLIVKKSEIYSGLEGMSMLAAGMLLVLVPLSIFVLYFLTRHVTNPISKLVEASHQIRSGDMGVQIPGVKENMPNKEFAYLMVSFNKMSAKIRYLFDYAYNEQLARKDAKIMALQSQINPHFLNNTLEMMNWQARMAGDIAVSKMIEALSTLLGYSMDRTNQRVISLAEEIRCADAYLYIISMRFGQRLVVEREIDEQLLQIKVPQLILQPLLENAVVHGVETKKRGIIWLKVYRENDLVVLEVLNTGNIMSHEDVLRVEGILAGNAGIENKAGKHVSLGIRNVNERIKLIYGAEYGLSIKPGEKDITAATIKIPDSRIES